ncbi:unnamed protein product (macronuclear) [Paramecium tetraurelia]|uniref:AAA+ ATPase domain-containing protein n=1 Tax=Paramecium tetraurelia TaxID=5888 RepID=A0DGV4_PARTE|nr:uncharacterized protein GSPATT00002400001 [Paramecium tetraurelia]CAK82271.1 unnamed protein product [Paramecium tetraurelia]|eukprot:XP_001449668.1 hypothetical protein (macronuclear) [Paramecium tetraurelia strain d4-2]
MSTPALEQNRKKAILLIHQGKKLFMGGKTYEIKQQGFLLMKQGCIELNQYSKEEPQEDYKSLAKQKTYQYYCELEQMKQYLLSKVEFAKDQQNIIQDKNLKNQNQIIENQNQRINIDNIIIKEKLNVFWEDIAGLEQAKQSLKEAVILPLQHPNLFQGTLKPWTGILLYGPPGTGKTFLAKACATESHGTTFISVSSADLISKYSGESEKSIKELFQLARSKKPSIIFIDEVDSLASDRESSGSSDNLKGVKNQLLIEFQGIGSNNDQVLILGATNLPWAIDSAIRRRFEQRIYIPLPDYKGRFYLIQNQLRKTPNCLTLDQMKELANKLDGYSGSDINNLIRDASLEQLRILQKATHFKRVQIQNQMKYTVCSASDPQAEKITMKSIEKGQIFVPEILYDDFLAVLPKCKPSVSKGDLEKYEDWTQQFGQKG